MRAWMIVLLLFANQVFAQEMLTKVIDLNYVSANQVITLIKPLLQTGEAVSGSGQMLVVKVSPDTLTQVRLVLHKLDQPPTTFQVEIYQGTPDWLNMQQSGGETVTYSTSGEYTQRQSQSVKVLDGAAAFVSTGEDIPVLSAVGVGWSTGVAYQRYNASTGFFVQPHLEGSRVKLTIKRVRQQQNPQNDQQFDNQQLDTTMMVPLGKWVSLGSAEGPDSPPSTTQTYSAGNKFSHNATLYIKVSVVK